MSKHVLITGMYRSGTTLLHHLLDGHDDLNVFPVENCIFRDTLVHQHLPFPEKRSMIRLLELIEGGAITEAVEYILRHEKLALPLTKKIVLCGSTGDQQIENILDVQRFRSEIALRIHMLPVDCREKLINSLFEAYLSAYYAAVAKPIEEENVVFVNKCPEAGLLISHYLEHISDVKIIHVVRDPRAVVASFKAKLPKKLFHPFFRILPQIRLLKHSFEVADNFLDEPRVMLVRYEDLVSNTKNIMRRVADFIGVPFNLRLIEPTVLGLPWKSNSSNLDERDNRYKVSANLDKYRNKLNEREVALVESICRSVMLNFGYRLDTPAEKLNESLNVGIYTLRSLFSIRTYLFKLRQLLFM